MEETPLDLLKRLRECRLDREEVKKELHGLYEEEKLILARLMPLFEPEEGRTFFLLGGRDVASHLNCYIYRGYQTISREDYLNVNFTQPENPALLVWPTVETTEVDPEVDELSEELPVSAYASDSDGTEEYEAVPPIEEPSRPVIVMPAELDESA